MLPSVLYLMFVAGFLQGSRSSTASVEDLLQDASLSEPHGSAISASTSSISLSSSTFEGDSALGNSQTSIPALDNSPKSNGFGGTLRLAQIKQESTDSTFEGEDESKRTSSVLRGDSFKQVSRIELSCKLLCVNLLHQKHLF